MLITHDHYDSTVNLQLTTQSTSTTQGIMTDLYTEVDGTIAYQSTLQDDTITVEGTIDHTIPSQNESRVSTSPSLKSPKDILVSTYNTGLLTTPSEATVKQPLAVDTQVRLIRLITMDYSAEIPISQLEDKRKWSPHSPRNQKQSYILSSIPSCHGYISETAGSINTNLQQKPKIPDIDADSLTYPYAYSCTNSSDTYVIPYLSGSGNSGSFSPNSEEVGRRVLDPNMSRLIMYLLPVSKMDLHMRVKDIRQQGYSYACIALDICGYTIIATQSDDTTIFYLVVGPAVNNNTYEGVHLELVCNHALLVLLDENKWIYGVEDPVIISDAISLVQVNDYNYSAVYPTESYCTVRILKSFWGYFATKSILEKLR